MAETNPSEVTWTGETGTTYRYFVYEMPFNPSANQDGNYIFTKLVNNRWRPIYFGQGDLKDRYDAAIKERCVTQKGATHYHVHLNGNATDRRAEEKDLIAGYPNCRKPVGCNERG